MIKFYLGQDPILPNVKTYICSEEPDLRYVLENLDKLVVKATNESGGYGMLMGHQASQGRARRVCRRRSRPDPRGFIAQPVIELSQCPSHIEGERRPRRVLRGPPRRPAPYILYGEKVVVMPAG
jgi:uncharacterized circularly permuted ATP-grasp superfamily protein